MWEIYLMVLAVIVSAVSAGGLVHLANPLVIAPIVGLLLRKRWALYWSLAIIPVMAVLGLRRVVPGDRGEIVLVNLLCIVVVIGLSLRSRVKESWGAAGRKRVAAGQELVSSTRRDLGLTIYEFAEKIGATSRDVEAWELGKAKAPTEVQDRVRALGEAGAAEEPTA